MVNLAQQEELVRKYLSEDNRAAAIQLLFDLAVGSARQKDFKAAESFRDWIFTIDPMALTEIIRSGEIIEEEKNRGIDKGHRGIWSGLYDLLNMEEANALYFALHHVSFGPGETIYAQGERSPRLFFVNNGRLKIVYHANGAEILLKFIDQGQIAGEETFFFDTVCTTSMKTVSSAELSYLDAGMLKGWKADFPMLESKLQEFASKFEKIHALLRAKDMDRRAQKRIPVTGKSIVSLKSSSGKPVGKPFKVEMCDISQGGASFLMRITKKETASLLLGQKLSVGHMDGQASASNGTIVAVRFHPFEDCTIHVKFDNLLSKNAIAEIERLPGLAREQNFWS